MDRSLFTSNKRLLGLLSTIPLLLLLVSCGGGGGGGGGSSGDGRLPTTGSTSPPSAPTSLSISSKSSSSISLTWTDSSDNETGFYIERSLSSTSGFSQVGSVSSNVNTYSSFSLSASTTYYFRVRAYNGNGDSAYSNTASSTTNAPASTLPSAPSGLTASAASSSSISLGWTDNATNEDGFKIERSLSSTSGFAQIATVGAGTASYSSTGLNPSTLYYYRVRAYNGAGNSTYSNIANATTNAPAATTPSAPSGLTATSPSTSSISLNWTDNANDEDGFKVERSLSSTTGFTQVDQVGPNSTSYYNSGLSSSTLYYYRVRAANGAGNSAFSNTTSATTQTAPPAGPTLSGPSSSSGLFSISWTFTWPGMLGSNQDGYDLQESSTSPSSGFTTIYKTAIQGVADHSTSGSRPLSKSSGTYYYRIRAYTYLGYTEWSNGVAVTVTASGAPTLTITNNFSSTGSNTVLQLRIGPNLSTIRSNAAYEVMGSVNSCYSLPGVDVAPGETVSFDVSDYAPNYSVYIGLGRWDFNGFCTATNKWARKLWSINGSYNQFWIATGINVTNHSGDYPWTLRYEGSNLVVDAGGTLIPFYVYYTDQLSH